MLVTFTRSILLYIIILIVIFKKLFRMKDILYICKKEN